MEKALKIMAMIWYLMQARHSGRCGCFYEKLNILRDVLLDRGSKNRMKRCTLGEGRVA